MSTERDRASEQLDQYMDGLMNESERAEFERHLQSELSLAEQLSLQHRIDSALRERFTPPKVIPTGAAAGKSRTAPRWPMRLGAGIAAAAAIAIAGYAVWPSAMQLLGGRSRSGPTPIHFVPIGPFEAYRAHVDSGLTPEWICKDDAEFAQTLEKAVGQSLVVAATPGLDVLGWSYNKIEGNTSRGVFTGYTLYLLTKARGAPVVVLIDRAAYDRQIESERADGLRIFRRQIGDAVLYEVTPLDQPMVLERFTPYTEPADAE